MVLSCRKTSNRAHEIRLSKSVFTQRFLLSRSSFYLIFITIIILFTGTKNLLMMKTGTQDKASNQISVDKIDSNKNLLAGTTQPDKSADEICIDADGEDDVSPCSAAKNVPNDTCKSTDSITLEGNEGQVEVNNANSKDESSNYNNVELSTEKDNTIRRSGRKISSTCKVTSPNDSNVPIILVDSHSKSPVTGSVAQIAKNKPMAIKVVGKTELSTQDLVAKAKKMLTFLTRSKNAKKSVAQNSKPIKKVVTSTSLNVKKLQLSNLRSQKFKEDVMKELIASTPSGFSVTRTYSGIRDKLKESRLSTDASSSTVTPATASAAARLTSLSAPNLTSSIPAKSPASSASTFLTGCAEDISTIELFDDGLKPATSMDVPSVNQSSQDLLSKNRCAISICKHMSGECNLASRTSESSDGRAWYNFLRVADPAHYTTPTCPMKQIFLCFCHFSPEYVVYAPRLRSHSIPTISLPRHLNQNSTIKNKNDRIKDERLLHKKLQDSETKVRELEYKVKNMNSILSKFSQDELRKIQGRAVKWSKGTLEKAISVRALVGPSAYEHISKLFPLPSLRVLNNLPDEFLKELNVDRLSFPSKNKGKSKSDKPKANQEKETAKKRRGANKNQAQAVSTVTSSTAEGQSELNQAVETINSQAVAGATCTIPRTQLDEFASHALLDISHMYPSNQSMGSLTLASLTPENSSLQMSQAFAEIDFSSFSSPMPSFSSSVLSTPQATSVQTIHVTGIPSSSTPTCTVTNNSPSKSIALVAADTNKVTKGKANSTAAPKAPSSGIIYSRKRKLVITPRFGRNAPKAANVTGKNSTNLDQQTSTINLPDGNQLELNNSITMEIDLPPFEMSSSSSSISHKMHTYASKSKNSTASRSPRETCASASSPSSTSNKTDKAGNSSSVTLNANSVTAVTDNGEPAVKKSKEDPPVKFELVATENLSSKERITVFNVLTEIHVKFKAQYHRCSTCCLFLHGDALNQFMRMVETNIVKYSHFLSDLASTSVKTFQEEMLQFVKKLKPDIFPKCPLYNEHLRFLIIEYISASINCKRSKMSSSAGSSVALSSNQVTSNSNPTNKSTSRGQVRKNLSSTPSSLSSVNDLVNTKTALPASAGIETNDAHQNDPTSDVTINTGQPTENLSSSSSVTATLVR